MAYHAEVAVVDNGNVDLNFFLEDGGQFAHGHLKAAVSDDYPDFRFRPRNLCADCSRQGESHRAQSTGSNQGTRRVVVIVLRLPHLVLSYVGHHDRVAASLAP